MEETFSGNPENSKTIGSFTLSEGLRMIYTILNFGTQEVIIN